MTFKNLKNIIIIYIIILALLLLYSTFFHQYISDIAYQLYYPDLPEGKIEQIATIEEIPIYKTIDIEVSDEVIDEIRAAIRKLPDTVKEYKPGKITLLGTKYIESETLLELVNTAGGFASKNITITENPLQYAVNSPDSEFIYEYIEGVIYHEWMHVVQYYQKREKDSAYTEFIEDSFFDVSSDNTFNDFARTVGWEEKQLFNLPIFTELDNSESSQKQSDYGKTSPIEDQACALEAVLNGQEQIISDKRVTWLEERFEINRDSYKASIFPNSYILEIQSEQYMLDKDSYLLKTGDDGRNERIDELLEVYPYFHYASYNIDNNLALEILNEMDEEVTERFILINDSHTYTSSTGKTCEAREYKTYKDVRLIYVCPDQQFIIMDFSKRTKLIDKIKW